MDYLGGFTTLMSVVKLKLCFVIRDCHNECSVNLISYQLDYSLMGAHGSSNY